MKKAKVARAKSSPKVDVDLRRWCVEQAIRWPVVMEASYGGQSIGGAFRPNTKDDLLARADKILEWVTK